MHITIRNRRVILVWRANYKYFMRARGREGEAVCAQNVIRVKDEGRGDRTPDRWVWNPALYH